MPTCRVKIGFWLRAYDTVEIDVDDGDDIIDCARKRALAAMQEGAPPEYIDTDERREGIICWIDRVGLPVDEATIAEEIEFDDDRIRPDPITATPETASPIQRV